MGDKRSLSGDKLSLNGDKVLLIGDNHYTHSKAVVKHPRKALFK